MTTLPEVEWLFGQVTPREAAARLRLGALRALSRGWSPRVPADLAARPFFKALSDRDALRRAFKSAGLLDACVAEAERILAGEFTLFGGYSVKAEGGVPDWLAGLPAGDRWSNAYAFDVDIESEGLPDVRFTWELSRHGDLVALARAAFLTGDERFSDRLAALLSDWMRVNPFLAGPNWMSALEVAMRAVAWSFIDDAAGDAPAMKPLGSAFEKALFAHGSFLERFSSRGLNPSNHVIGEAVGLLVVGMKFAACQTGRRWRARARRILSDEIFRQTFDCGASREQAAGYHRFVTSLLSLCLAVDPRGFSPRFKARLADMYAFLAAIARPDGSFPRFGDGDDAVALRLSPPRPNDLTGDLALGAALFPDRKVAAPQKPSPEALWLLGPAPLSETKHAAPPPKSAFLPGPGLAVLRAPSGKLQLEFDCGPQGFSPVSSHGHADALSVTVWRGADRLVDAGTYRYNAARAWRDAFRSTAIHNTLTVDGLPQALTASAFRWVSLADARPGAVSLSREIDYASATLPPSRSRPSSHRREVLRVGDALVIIIDALAAAGPHEARAYFHFGKAAVSAGGDCALVRYEDGSVTSLFRARASARFEVIEASGPLEPAWRSPVYGVKEPSASVVATTEFKSRVTLPWVIAFEGEECIRRVEPEARGTMAVEVAAGGSRFLFVCPDEPGVAHAGGVKLVGDWVLIELSAGEPLRAFGADVWALEYRGKRLYTRVGGKPVAFVYPPGLAAEHSK